MKRSELILEFIDGTLDGTAEQELFNELARQPEYRTEMRQFIAIGEAVRADREAFMPPLAVERALMAGLGLAPLAGSVAGGATAGAAAGAGASGAAVPAASFLAGLLAKFGVMKGLVPFIASFVLGGLVVGGGVYLGMKENSATTPGAPAANVVAARPGLESSGGIGSTNAATGGGATAPAATGPATTIRSAPSATSVESPSASGPIRSRGAGIADRSSRTRAAGSRRSNPAREPFMEPSRLAPDSPAPILASDSSLERGVVLPAVTNTSVRDAVGIDPVSVDSTGVIASRSPFAVRPIDMPETSDAQARLVAEIRGAGTFLRNDNNAKVLRSVPVQEVFSAGVSYRFDENFQFGVEGGSERFWQTYYYNSTDGGNNKRVIRTDQAPLLWWGGVSGRYNATSLVPFEGLTPFAQLTLGAASHGPLARARIGTQFDLASLGIPGFALTTAAEGSTLLYFFNRQSLASTNAGASIGLEISLW